MHLFHRWRIAVGKTSLLLRFTKGKVLRNKPHPSGEDQRRVLDLGNGTQVAITIKDTAGQEQFK